jgi:hypothetical protein
LATSWQDDQTNGRPAVGSTPYPSTVTTDHISRIASATRHASVDRSTNPHDPELKQANLEFFIAKKIRELQLTENA